MELSVLFQPEKTCEGGDMVFVEYTLITMIAVIERHTQIAATKPI